MATILPESHAANGSVDSSERLSQDLIDKMQAIFGKFRGYRTTHAKGWLVEGTFTPTAEAKKLSIAPHFGNASTKVLARFSVGSGLPAVLDTDNKATPKGVAIRFLIDEDTHTDLIAHSFNGFATSTGEGFLEFLSAAYELQDAFEQMQKIPPSDPRFPAAAARAKRAKEALDTLANLVPSIGEFLNGDRPNPHNYGTIKYYEPNTHVLINDERKRTNIRYVLEPKDGVHLYTADEIQKLNLPAHYLEQDLIDRFPAKPLIITLKAHIASPNDILDDATVPYNSKDYVTVGTLEFNRSLSDSPEEQQQIAFSPLPSKGGVKGIEESNDPLIQARKGVYWISADQRRHEKRVPPAGAIN